MKNNWRKAHKDKAYLEQLLETPKLGNEAKLFIRHYAVYAAKRCNRMRAMYYILNIAIIILPIITFAIDLFCGQPLSFSDIFSIILSAMVTICASLLTLLRCHDTWIRYRDYLERLISIVAKYTIGQPSTETGCTEKMVDELLALNDAHLIDWKRERDEDQARPAA